MTSRTRTARLIPILALGVVLFISAPALAATAPATPSGTTPTSAKSTGTNPPQSATASGGSTQTAKTVAAPPAAATSQTFTSITNFGLFQNYSTSAGLGAFLNQLYKYLMGIAAILAVLEIIWGGFLWMGSGASVTSKGAGKTKIIMALSGLLLVLSPVIIFNLINPQVLNLQLSTKSLTPQAISTASTTPPTPIPTTKCITESNSGPYLETAVCPSRTLAQNYTCKNGLNPTLVPCGSGNYSASGSCLDKSVTVYCGKTITVTEYGYTHHGFLGISSTQVVPRDQKTATDFTNGCNANGGVVLTSATWMTKLKIASLWANFFKTCSSATQVTYNISDGTGVYCATADLQCVPPGSQP